MDSNELEESLLENKSEDKTKSILNERMDSIENNSKSRDVESDQQKRCDSRHSADSLPSVSAVNSQANIPNVENCEEFGFKSTANCVINDENYSEYYNSYYANYYQHCGLKSGYSESDSYHTKSHDSKPRPMDLINKALAKQSKTREDSKYDADGVKADEDEEEGQIPSSPRGVSKESSTPSNASSPSTHTRNSQSISHSRSPSRDHLLKSRSRSRSRRRYISRSRSRSRQRHRRTRSRSPYLGPIIKDYRRGRRGFVRYPRGYRDRGLRTFRRGHQSHYIPYGFSRRHDFSRSRSRSFSPNRRHIENNRSDNNSDEEKVLDSKHSDTQKPSDINISQKRITQSFLAMLEEKQNKSKMIPIEAMTRYENSEGDDSFNKQHGFVNTFNTVREMDAQKHNLSYDLEREGWQVVDDANSESLSLKHTSKDINKYEHKVRQIENFISQEKNAQMEMDVDSSSSDEMTKNKKKKSKKRKKRRKRKASTTTDSSDSESDNENEDQNHEKNEKKKFKKKKKSKKKKKKVMTSSSSSENDEKEDKHKKKKKRKKESSSDSESEEKIEDNSLTSNSKIISDTNDMIGSVSSIPNEVIKDCVKTKDKKKKKRKSKTTESSDSDSEEDNKKKKKKNKKKKSKKRRHRSSSSSNSSDSSDSSESGDRKKKKKKKSKKSKKLKKHKKEKKSEKKEKSKLSQNEDKKKVKLEEDSKQSEFLIVYSVGDPPLELKWPKKLIKYTECEPSLQYSVNPKVPIIADDFKQIKDRNRNIEEFERNKRILTQIENENEMISEKENPKLTSEYERFIDELNPSLETHPISEESLVLEMKMREKLLKHLSGKKDSESPDLVTSSDKRAIEKMKKQSFHTFDEKEENRRHEDLKHAPMSAYYSTKKQHKSSPNHKSDDSDKYESKSKPQEVEQPLHKTNEISLSIGEKTHNKIDSQNGENTKIEDKKRTARELLERVKQKRHSNRDIDHKEKDDSHKSRRNPQIGKMKIPSKKSKSLKTSITTANADSTQNTFISQPMKLDMNFDYNWYYRYYMNCYGMAQYPPVSDPSLASAYYANYAMLTSYDYKQSDVHNWMSQRGYTIVDNNYVMTENQTNVAVNEEKPLKSDESCVESSAQDLNSALNYDANIPVVESQISGNTNEQSVDKVMNEPNEDNEVNKELNNELPVTEINGLQKIEVLATSSYSGIPLDQTNCNETELSPNMSPFSSTKFKHKVKVRVTANSLNDNESIDGSCSPPPPPPTPRPQMTTFISSEPITLPNGQVLPSGTKQIVVHPYQTNDSSKFTAEWYYNSLNTTQTTNETQEALQTN